MKSLARWFCLIAAAGSHSLYAAEDGLEAYRQGNYALAAESLGKQRQAPAANYYLGLMRLYGYGELRSDRLALRYFTQAAEQGYLPAQNLLARYYLIKEQKPDQALVWFKKAATAGDMTAQLYVAAAYLFGYGAQKNEDMARHFYIEAAKKGNSLAQYTLGMNFLHSRDNNNKKMGIIWLTKSADNANPQAQFQLGSLYASGSFVTRDPEKAKEFLTKAANLGDPKAQAALGQLYLDAKTSFYSSKTGLEWLNTAAKNGCHEAQIGLAQLYKEGKVVNANEELAKYWEDAAQKTASTDQQLKGEQAVAKWLSNDKNDRLSDGVYQLGGIYNAWQNPQALKENNYNQPPQMDVITRQELYKPQFVMINPEQIPVNDYFDVLAPMLASEQTYLSDFPRYDFEKQIRALLRDESLVLYHNPDDSILEKGTSSVAANEVEPFNYLDELVPGWQHKVNFQMALNQLYGEAILGDSTAQFELGQLYQYGVGVAKNIPQAIEYFQLAAAQQDVRAEYNLGLVYLEGQTMPVDYHKGIEWMTDAAFKGNAYAQYVLGNIYEHGLKDAEGAVVVAPNHNQAMAMYYLASSNHFGKAEFRLADYLIKEKHSGLSVAAQQHRNKLIKRLYQGAVHHGIAEAVLPLAFYNAMDGNTEKQKQAFQVASQRAEEGDPEAALLLGMMYERGIATPADKNKSLEWYQKAPMNPVNAFILGTYYTEGTNVAKDEQKGRELLQQAADAGFAYANYNLAILNHQQGQNFLDELDKARQAGNSKAGLLLADYYLLNDTDPEKINQAASIYRYFAEKGDKDAEMKLGFMYERGLMGEVNNQQAAYWYTQSAEQDQTVAQYLLGQMLQLGRVSNEPDYTQAKKWYQAALKNETKAAVALAFVYDTVDNDYVNAAKYYEQAAKADNAIAQYDLALIYEFGKGMPIDNKKARSLYLQSAKQGYPKAMTQLAQMTLNGIGGERNDGQALEWFKKAAELGENNALYQLGLLSETGIGSTLDMDKALNYYTQAARLGNDKAKLALARMYQYGLGVTKDYQTAVSLYKELAADSNAYAQYQLAVIYLSGVLGNTLDKEGQALLAQASDNGNSQAKVMIQWLNARKEPRLSFIQPIALNRSSIPLAQHSADLMYLQALNEWNRGDEVESRQLLNQLIKQFPQYEPAQRVFKQLQKESSLG